MSNADRKAGRGCTVALEPRDSDIAVIGALKRQLRKLQAVDSLIARRRGQARVQFIESVLPKGAVGAEIGVFKGLFIPFLLQHARPKQLYLMDPWYLLGEEWTWAEGDRSTIAALNRIMRTHAADLASGRIVLEIGDDLELLQRKAPDFFDWVYLDTTHSYEQTLEELSLLKSRVKPGGVIAGDDWHSDPGHRHHGVCRAVKEFAAAEGYELIYADDADWQWAVRVSPASGRPKTATPGD